MTLQIKKLCVLALSSAVSYSCRSNHRKNNSIEYALYLLRSGDTDVPHACLLLEGLYTGFTVIPLRRHGGHVRPVEEAQDLGHGLGLIEVRGHGAGEVIIAGFVAEFGACRRVAYLRDLEEPEKIGNLREEMEK